MIGTQTKIQSLSLDDYVRGSVLAEANLRDPDKDTTKRVAQIQAILARTYALANLSRHGSEGFDLCSTTHCQVYRPSETWPAHLQRVADEAVNSTRGIVVTHSGIPINAVFHADCGGHTSDAETIWRGSAPPYLRGKRDTFCLGSRGQHWRFEVSTSALRRALNQHSRTRVGERLDTLVVTERDVAGRAARVMLRGEYTTIVRGEQLRATILPHFGPRSLRSTRFSVQYKEDLVVFEGQGFGHGVGLCQAGALARARAGQSPQDILKHYYPGVVVAPWNDNFAPMYRDRFES